MIMSVLIIEEKPPHFTDVEFEYKGIEFKAQICLLDTGKVMISFRVPKNELEQNLCKGLLQTVDKTLLVSTPEAFFLFWVQKVCT